MKEVNARLEIIAKCNCPECGEYIENSYSKLWSEDEVICPKCGEIFTMLILA